MHRLRDLSQKPYSESGDARSLPQLRIEVRACRACDLWQTATQPVFGEGPEGACRPWLDAEITAVRPSIVVCLGATAAQALLGSQFKVTARRGVFVPSPLAPHVLATVHPSSILRAPDEASRRAEMKRFTSDLRTAAGALSSE